MVTTTTTKAEQRKAERVLERQRYIENAQVVLKARVAIVTSEFDDDKEYVVDIENGKACSCGCDDFFYRSRRNPQHECKHMTATNEAIKATKPAKKARAPRRSAVNAALIASLQVPENVKVRKVRLGGLKVAKQAMPKQCPLNAHVAMAA